MFRPRQVAATGRGHESLEQFVFCDISALYVKSPKYHFGISQKNVLMKSMSEIVLWK